MQNSPILNPEVTNKMDKVDYAQQDCHYSGHDQNILSIDGLLNLLEVVEHFKRELEAGSNSSGDDKNGAG
jgi:hypothetical protein